MKARRDKKHLLVPNEPMTEAYRPYPRRTSQKPFAGPEDRQAHARALSAALRRAQEEAAKSRTALGLDVYGAEQGLYIEFESPPGVELKLESLEDRGKGIELVAVQSIKTETGGPPIQRATVFVPDGRLKYFLSKFEQYATEQTKKGEPRHKDLVDPRPSILTGRNGLGPA